MHQAEEVGGNEEVEGVVMGKGVEVEGDASGGGGGGGGEGGGTMPDAGNRLQSMGDITRCWEQVSEQAVRQTGMRAGIRAGDTTPGVRNRPQNRVNRGYNARRWEQVSEQGCTTKSVGSMRYSRGVKQEVLGAGIRTWG